MCVFANVEYDKEDPPKVIEIRGERYVREEKKRSMVNL